MNNNYDSHKGTLQQTLKNKQKLCYTVHTFIIRHIQNFIHRFWYIHFMFFCDSLKQKRKKNHSRLKLAVLFFKYMLSQSLKQWYLEDF